MQHLKQTINEQELAPKRGARAFIQASGFNMFKAKGAADNQRLNAMSDGVFSIVITLMVFSIKIPDVAPSQVSSELPSALLRMIPDLMSVFLGFMVLGIYWVGHNNVFLHVNGGLYLP